jgi:hypothetical protein
MRRVLLLIFWQFGLLAGGPLIADIVTMKDGRQISGLVESGNIQELHIKVGDQSQRVDVHEVQAIQFGVSLPAPPAAAPPPKAADLAPAPAAASAAPTVQASSAPHAVPQQTGGGKAAGGGAAAKNVPENPCANKMPQPAFIDSKRGCQ